MVDEAGSTVGVRGAAKVRVVPTGPCPPERARDLLTSAPVRQLAIDYAAKCGMAGAGVTGNVQVVPYNAAGEAVYDLPEGAPVASRQAASFAAIVPLAAGGLR
jgi:hypothetical protein